MTPFLKGHTVGLPGVEKAGVRFKQTYVAYSKARKDDRICTTTNCFAIFCPYTSAVRALTCGGSLCPAN